MAGDTGDAGEETRTGDACGDADDSAGSRSRESCELKTDMSEVPRGEKRPVCERSTSHCVTVAPNVLTRRRRPGWLLLASLQMDAREDSRACAEGTARRGGDESMEPSDAVDKRPVGSGNWITEPCVLEVVDERSEKRGKGRWSLSSPEVVLVPDARLMSAARRMLSKPSALLLRAARGAGSGAVRSADCGGAVKGEPRPARDIGVIGLYTPLCGAAATTGGRMIAGAVAGAVLVSLFASSSTALDAVLSESPAEPPPKRKKGELRRAPGWLVGRLAMMRAISLSASRRWSSSKS